MAWTHTVESYGVTNNGLGLFAIVRFTDGVTTTPIRFDFSEPASLRILIRQQLAQYERVAAAIAAPPIAGQPVDLADPADPTPTPTPAQLAARALAAELARRERRARYASVGMVNASGALVPDPSLPAGQQAALLAELST